MDRQHKILIVDDEPVNIQVIKSALKELYHIIEAQSGFDAIELIKEHNPDLILLDVMMPDIDGFDVCKIIKSDPAFAETPIVFLTALDTREGQFRGLDSGAIDYLTKPVDFDLLKLRVRNLLESKARYDLLKEQRDIIAKQKEELDATLNRVKQLEGIIPICMYCKKIRDDQNVWNQLEAYITQHSEAKFSHGMCPDCAKDQMKMLESESEASIRR